MIMPPARPKKVCNSATPPSDDARKESHAENTKSKRKYVLSISFLSPPLSSSSRLVRLLYFPSLAL